jgi:hypothetical protein
MKQTKEDKEFTNLIKEKVQEMKTHETELGDIVSEIDAQAGHDEKSIRRRSSDKRRANKKAHREENRAKKDEKRARKKAEREMNHEKMREGTF